MAVGLGTYALFWHWAETNEHPLSLIDMLDLTAQMGVAVFQICDYPALERFSEVDLRDVKAAADERSIHLELGTRGLVPEHLRIYLSIAEILDVSLLRSMLYSADSRPRDDEALSYLDRIGPELSARGVDLALETYEQVSTDALVRLVERAGHERIGICLDPANCVAALEHPRHVVDRAASFVKNVHAKDFQFTRRADWVGFDLIGAPMGQGLLDYAHLMDRVRPETNGISQIIEHWLPWQGDAETAKKTEISWTRQSLNQLRSPR